MVLVLVLVAGAIASGAYLLPRRSRPPAPPAAAPAGEQLTVLLAMRAHDDVSGHAAFLTLFAAESSGDGGPLGLFVPVTTLGQIPGQGFEPVGKALSVGDPALQRMTVENLLGIAIDRTVVTDEVTLGALVDELGGITLVVEERLEEEEPDGTRAPLFPLGEQRMDGAAAATYLTYRADDGSEVERFVRVQKVWDGIFAHGADAVARALDVAFGGADANALRAPMRAFAAAAPAARAYQVLPVEAAGATGEDETYRVVAARVAEVVRRDLAGSVPRGVDPGARPRVEIRNGNGEPQSGARVAGLLIPAGFKLEVTGNAGRFDHERTRIVVYREDEAALALARKVRELLGVGKIEIGTRGQTVVDLTVVVGKDLIGKE